jgi:hypothetical protein
MPITVTHHVGIENLYLTQPMYGLNQTGSALRIDVCFMRGAYPTTAIHNYGNISPENSHHVRSLNPRHGVEL